MAGRPRKRFHDALVSFRDVWTEARIREEKLNWRCHEARELACKRLHPEVLGACDLTDVALVKKIHGAFGAPGDFGYGTPEGDCLRDLYESDMKGEA